MLHNVKHATPLAHTTPTKIAKVREANVAAGKIGAAEMKWTEKRSGFQITIDRIFWNFVNSLLSHPLPESGVTHLELSPYKLLNHT